MPRLRSPRAFTLIELIVVIAITAILAAVATVAFTSVIQGTRQPIIEAKAHQISKLLQSESAAQDKTWTQIGRDSHQPPRTASQAASNFLGVTATATGDAVEAEFGPDHHIYAFAPSPIRPVIVVRTQDTGAMKLAYITLATTVGGPNTVTATNPTP